MGVSKHYVLQSRGGVHIDYEIPDKLKDLMPMYAGNRNRVQDMQLRFGEMYETPSWRQRIQRMWKLKTQAMEGNLILTEYRVYPGRTGRTCPFRNVASAYREVPSKKRNPGGYQPPPPAHPMLGGNARNAGQNVLRNFMHEIPPWPRDAARQAANAIRARQVQAEIPPQPVVWGLDGDV